MFTVFLSEETSWVQKGFCIEALDETERLDLIKSFLQVHWGERSVTQAAGFYHLPLLLQSLGVK